MAWMTAIAAGLNIYGAQQQAAAGNEAAKVEQAQLNAAALSAEGQSQYEAEAQRRKAELMISRALAVGASSGAGTSGLDYLLRDIGAEGETAAGYALYGGTEKAKGLRYRGEVGVAEAKAKGRATLMSAIGQSAMSLAAAYGGGGAPAAAGTAKTGSNSWFTKLTSKSGGRMAPIEERVWSK